MNYEQALEYIHTRNMHTRKDGLNNITALCDKLGNPQNRLKFIHIAGTNGKGSVAAYISSTLKAAGYRTGTCISPFVTVFNERIQINGSYISDSDLALYTQRVADAGVPVTEFEFITALAFLYFADKRCDYVVLEAGMGGRFDATNIIKSPGAAVITLIDFDHTAYLGAELSEIAWHKCGIIKKGCKVFTLCGQHPQAEEQIKKTCAEQDAELIMAGSAQAAEFLPDKTRFSYGGTDFEITMQGDFQPQNAALAIEVLRGIGIEDRYIKEGLKRADMSCRFQIVRKDPYLIFDGAHNPSGCDALARSLEKYRIRKPTVIFGMSDDKEYKKCIKILAPLAGMFIATGFENPRAAKPDLLKKEAEKYCPDTGCASDINRAFALASSNSDIVVCGSLYLVSEAAKRAGI